MKLVDALEDDDDVQTVTEPVAGFVGGAHTQRIRIRRDRGSQDFLHSAVLGAWMAIQSVFMCGARLSHPVGHQLGASWGIPHGVTSCIALPASMRALNEITPAVSSKVAPLFGTTNGNKAADELTKFVAQLGLPTRLRDTDAVESEIPQVASAIEHEFQTMGREAEVDVEALLRSMW